MAETSEYAGLDTRELVTSMRRLESRVQEVAKRVLGQATNLAERLVKQTDAFKDRTGKLRGTIATVEKGPFRSFVQIGGQSAPYARWLENGSRAHVIAARRAKMLRFVQNGQVRFAKSVFHPGTKPARFMAKTALEVESNLDAMTAGITWD